MSADESPLLDVRAVAQRLNVPVSWVYATAEAGKLPHIKLGRYLRFVPSDITEHLAAQRRGGNDSK